MTPRRTVRVLPPEMPFAAVHAAFVGDGWAGGPVTRTPPLLADEPEVARFRRGEDVATYALDPVVWLRTVTTASSSVPDLPWVTAAEVLGWLRTPGADEAARERRLLGVLAAADLGLRQAVPALRRLAASGDPLVGAAARRTLAGSYQTGHA